MIITHHGKQCFKLVLGDLGIVMNPISSGVSGVKASKFGADISISTTALPAYNGHDSLRGDKIFIINGPGEYEKQNIFFHGIRTQGIQDTINTIYTFELDNIRIVFAGATVEKQPQSFSENDVAHDIDILFVPIGQHILGAENAASLVKFFAPKLIIPMDYEKKDELKHFLDEVGVSESENVEKLSIKKRDIPSDNKKVITISES